MLTLREAFVPLIAPPSIYALVGSYWLSGHSDFRGNWAATSILLLGMTNAIVLVLCSLGGTLGLVVGGLAKSPLASAWLGGSLLSYLALGLLYGGVAGLLVSAPTAYVAIAWPAWFIDRGSRRDEAQ